jgi:predicted Fe-Mo cluster-binding NifX family protein
MKIALTTVSPGIESAVDPRFGRGAYLLVVDTETLQWHSYPNPGASATGGAGIQSAQFVSGQKVQAVLSGDFGPHAYTALELYLGLSGECYRRDPGCDGGPGAWPHTLWC